MSTMTPSGSIVGLPRLPASLDEVWFMVALEVVNDDPRRPAVAEISAGPHQRGGLDVPGGRWRINNPDTLYFAVPVEPGARYVIHGRRFDDGPVDRNFSLQVRDIWATLENVGQRELAFDAEGRYQITVDDPPAGGPPGHLRLQPRGSVMIVRQTFGDWATHRGRTGA